MKNNNGKGLYEIGERLALPCGCYQIVEEIGYTHFVAPECLLDNKVSAPIKGYRYRLIERAENIS